ncbi:SA1320 family protein [Sutcliffiella horikoshii]|uniref:SA1320 family protein n=1 Tax=Sutcliffiella horikoshii TaxID=79883 RepID=UPI001F3CD354|nr:hypothetical protein [Sutcliffiella horikoshii]MCG1022815.1 hypothetical protein [Sutcliffiella horikoshii]
MTTLDKDVNKSFTRDIDLVELAGYHSYLALDRGSEISVNGQSFRILDTSYGNSSGLDALTVVNQANKEITIAYVGTDTNQLADIKTDVQLLSKLTPTQLEEARMYFNKMQERYKDVGGVTSITGNSLGGALVAAVAIENPEVNAITLNPALLPEGMLDPNETYDNITNYFSTYDALTQTLMALNLDRIPGHRHEIYNGIPDFAMLGTNHTGYLRNSEGTQYYEIGIKGQPGYGKIYIDADSHIVTSIWTGAPLYGGNSERIEISKEQLVVLADALSSVVTERLELASSYMGNSVDIVEHEGNNLYQRMKILQEQFEDMFNNLVGDPLFRNIAAVSNRLKSEIDRLIILLDLAEVRCRSLNYVLNSPPAELLEFLFNKNVSVETVFGEARRQLNELREDVDGLTNILHSIVMDLIPELFQGGQEAWYDAVVGELRAHYGIVNGNREKLLTNIAEFKKQVIDVSEAFDKRDQSLGQAIRNNGGALLGIDGVQHTNTYNLEQSPYLLMKMKLKEAHVELAFSRFSTLSHGMLIPLLSKLHVLTFAIEGSLDTISTSIKGATHFAFNGTLTGKLIGLFSDFDDQVKSKVYTSLEPIDELASTIRGIRKGLNQLILGYPNLLTNFKPYLDSAIFSNNNFYNVHLYNLASINILKEMEILFADIIHQLSSQQAVSIDVLVEVSKKVKQNMGILQEQVERGTIS